MHQNCNHKPGDFRLARLACAGAVHFGNSCRQGSALTPMHDCCTSCQPCHCSRVRWFSLATETKAPDAAAPPTSAAHSPTQSADHPHLLEPVLVAPFDKAWTAHQLPRHAFAAEPGHLWAAVPVKHAKDVALVAQVVRDVRILLREKRAVVGVGSGAAEQHDRNRQKSKGANKPKHQRMGCGQQPTMFFRQPCCAEMP